MLTGWLALGDAATASEGHSPDLHWLAGGHPFGAAAVQFLADGQLLSAGAGLKCWDVSARRLERTLSTPRVGEDVVALGPGEAWAATVSWHPDRALILRELSQGRALQRLLLVDTNLPPMALSASPEGEWLLGSAGDGRIFRWHVPGGEALPPLHLQTLRPQTPGGWQGTLVTSNEFVATDFKVVFRARLEPPALLWERIAETSSKPVLSADRRWVAFSEANRVLVLDALTGETWREIVTDGPAPQHLVFSRDAARLVGTQRDLPVSVWRTADGALEFTLPGVAEIVTGLAVSPDGRTLAAGHNRGISLWDLESRHGPEDLTALPSVVYALGVSTNGLVAVGTGLGYMAVFDLARGERRAAWRPGSNGRALALAPSGEWLVTEGTDSTLSVHRLPETTLERSVPIPRSGLERLELSAAGDRLAAQPREGGPFVIRTADWTVERSFEVERNDWLRALRLSPDGQRLAGVLSDRSVRVWDVANGEVLRTLGPEYSGLLEWHDDGTRLWLLSSAGHVTRWNIATGELEYDQTLALDGANLVRALWLPDRSGVLLSLGDVGLELWRLDRPQPVIRYTVEVGRACLAMAFTPDNDRLLLGRYDATLTVAGLPFFLGARAAGPGETVVTAYGATGMLRWETRGDSGAWEVVPGQSGPELTLSASGVQRWVRAALAEASH